MDTETQNRIPFTHSRFSQPNRQRQYIPKKIEVTTGLAFQYWNCTHISVTTNGPGMIVPWLSSTQMRMDEMSMTQSCRLCSMYLKRKIERSFHMLTRRIGLWVLCLTYRERGNCISRSSSAWPPELGPLWHGLCRLQLHVFCVNRGTVA